MKAIDGFSLIELLVVIAILGILVSISIIGYAKYQENTRMTVLRSNLSSVASTLKTDIAALNAGINETSTLIKDRASDTCEEIAIASVKALNNSNFKNPFKPNENYVTAAYGNYMTRQALNGVVSIQPIRGSIIVSCSDPTLTPSQEGFLIYQCSCDTDDCSFDSYVEKDPRIENDPSICPPPHPSAQVNNINDTSSNPYLHD